MIAAMVPDDLDVALEHGAFVLANLLDRLLDAATGARLALRNAAAITRAIGLRVLLAEQQRVRDTLLVYELLDAADECVGDDASAVQSPNALEKDPQGDDGAAKMGTMTGPPLIRNSYTTQSAFPVSCALFDKPSSATAIP